MTAVILLAAALDISERMKVKPKPKEDFNPYKQPVVTLKQWVKEKKSHIDWQRILNKAGFVGKIDDEYMLSDWDFGKSEIVVNLTDEQVRDIETVLDETKEQRKQAFYELCERGIVATPLTIPKK